MRAQQSFTAAGKQSCFGTFTTHATIDGVGADFCAGDTAGRLCGLPTCPAAAHGEGLLHDARNLVGAIGLYCDLLSMPGVLKPEHRQYPEELRLLGARSRALIEALMRTLLALEKPRGLCESTPAKAAAGEQERLAVGDRQSADPKVAGLVSLRNIVERCSGLLSRVANGRPLAIDYGPAAATPVRVAEEAVERILVNLVRNAAAALDEGTTASSAGAIRITVGLLETRVGDAKPWPFQRVRLSVEDSGCGMDPEKLEWLMRERESSGESHGIGFRVVRELAAASDGELQVMSEVGSRNPRADRMANWRRCPQGRGCNWSPMSARGKLSLAAECRSRRLGDIRMQPEMEGAC